VARINHGPTIYLSGLYAARAKDAAEEVNEIFSTMRDLLEKTGSDLRHLAKATYYVSTHDASDKLNELRPRYYDPRRPPAASKAFVAGVGMPGKSLTLDMIAVPVPRKE
jgi:enamine deaminase RidA (YjgF/YER057c/UK114 family)